MELTRFQIISTFTNYCHFMLPADFIILEYDLVIMKAIDAAIDGSGPPRCMFFVPPQHGKTTIGADMFISYMFGRFPDQIGAYATFNEDFAGERKESVEMVLSSEKYKYLFPQARTRSNIEEIDSIDKSIRKTKKNTMRKISNVLTSRGEILFVGRGNALTGKSVNFGAVDDPYKDIKEAESDIVNEDVKKWFRKVFLTRRQPKRVNSNRPSQIIFLFYTRWVANDLAGMLIEDTKNNTDPNYTPWKIYRFAAERDESNDFDEDTYDSRKVGEPLHPLMLEAYADAKKDQDTWLAMYQQTPLDKKGRLFDISLFGYYHQWPRLCQLVISVDANFKEDSETVDRTGIGVWSKILNKYYLIMFINRKMNYPELRATVKALMVKYPQYWAVLIEVASNGGALYQELKDRFPRVIGIEPKSKSKRERAELMLPVHNAGQIMLPAQHLCPEIGEYVLEFARFTGLKKNEKDDLVDQEVMAINYYESNSHFEGKTLVDSVPNPNAIYYQQAIEQSYSNIIVVE